MLKAYLSAQISPLSAFTISKTLISGQKVRRRQLKAKCAVANVPFFVFFLLSFFVQLSIFQQWYLANSLSAHCHFRTKLMRSSTTTRCLHSFKFTLVNKSHSQHSEAIVHCLGRHFLILYACAPKVSFPDQRAHSWSVWHAVCNKNNRLI